LQQAARSDLWVARAVQQPGSRPLEFGQTDSLAARLLEWPTHIIVKCQCQYHPNDPPELRRAQERSLLRVAAACRAQGRELLLEIIAGGHGELRENTVAAILTRLYELDIRPEWWELEPPPASEGWARCAQVIADKDEYCRGIVVGLHAPVEQPAHLLALAAATPIVRGFIAGGSIFAGAAAAWLSGRVTAEAATEDIAEKFRELVAAWVCARDPRLERPERSGH
jgi:5-dehydro-2-deoxygluconokinase